MALANPRRKTMANLSKKVKSEAATMHDTVFLIRMWSACFSTTFYGTKNGENVLDYKRVFFGVLYRIIVFSSFIYFVWQTDLSKLGKLNEIQIQIFLCGLFEIILFTLSTKQIFFSSKKDICVFREFELINTELLLLDADIQLERIKKWLKIQILSIPLFVTFIVMFDYTLCFYNKTYENHELYFWIVYIELFCYNRIIQALYINCIIFASASFTTVNEEMKKFAWSENKKELFKQDANPKKRLKTIITIRNKLVRLCQYVNIYFGKQILLTIAYGTLSITFQTYAIMVVFMDNKYDWRIIVHEFGWITFRVLSLLSFVCVFTCTSEKANEMASIVHNVLNSNPPVDIIADLEHFSLQLLHNKLIFTACDFFPVNFTLLQSIAGTVTTYLIILIQFKLSEKST